MTPRPASGLADDPPLLRVVVLRRRRFERIWSLVEDERIALARRVRDLTPEQWDAPSRCEGWRVRDVLGHLVHMAESSAKSLNLKASDGHGGQKGFFGWAKEYGEAPGEELAGRLETAAGSRFNGMPAVALSEVLIHGDDMLQPLGLRASVRPEAALAALDLMRLVNRLAPRVAFNGRSQRGVRLVAEDVDWSTGHGPEASGVALDLLAVLSNRLGASASLTGPGVEKLEAREGPRSPQPMIR